MKTEKWKCPSYGEFYQVRGNIFLDKNDYMFKVVFVIKHKFNTLLQILNNFMLKLVLMKKAGIVYNNAKESFDPNSILFQNEINEFKLTGKLEGHIRRKVYL